MPSAPTLFDAPLPPGLSYRRDFITPEAEAALATAIGAITFSEFEMRGVVARRRVAFFGQSYDRASEGPIPPFLWPARAALAEWAGLEPEAFAMALINQYPPGAPIGWHRDAPQYDIVAGISLLSACRMKFRPCLPPSAAGGPARRSATHVLTLEPRSAYLMTGEARSGYEHHIPAVEQLRYSLTFRTLRP